MKKSAVITLKIILTMIALLVVLQLTYSAYMVYYNDTRAGLPAEVMDR